MSSKRIKVVTFSTICAMVVFVAVVGFTQICELEAVRFNGVEVTDWQERFVLQDNESVMQQPLHDFMVQILTNDSALKVDLSYDWPRTLKIELNSISPACLMVDKKDGSLLAIDDNARLIPIQYDNVDWERPVLTGMYGAKLYDYCPDIRIRSLLSALEKLRREKINFYRLIEQVDLSSSEFIEARIAGMPYGVWLRAEHFYDDITRFVDFVARYNPDLESVKVVDLRFDNLIITREKRT